MPSVGLNTTMRSFGVGKVIKTTDEAALPVGTYVNTPFINGVCEYVVLPIEGNEPCDMTVPLEMNLGPLHCVFGHTAWVGTKFADPKPGETYVVSGAAGAVGSIACQLGKAYGAKVIGIAGGPAKCKWVVDELGCDGCVDYKAESVSDGIKRLCPEGVDCYFDNVGGDALDAALEHANVFARVAFCGAIAQYNGGIEDKSGQESVGPKNYKMILMRRMMVKGFVCADHMSTFMQMRQEITALIQAGKMKFRFDVREGKVSDYVKTVNLLYSSGNQGKLILKIKDHP